MKQGLLDYVDLRHQIDLCESLEDRVDVYRCLVESFQNGELNIDRDFSIRGLFEATVDRGEEYLNRTGRRFKSGGIESLLEAADAVDSAAFDNITGQILFTRIREAYSSPEFLYPELADEQQTPFPYGERIPGVGPIGDKIGSVGEGEKYPTAGLNEEYIDVPGTTKKGLIVPVTREAIEFDRTGLVLKRAGEEGNAYGVDVEQRTLAVVVGTVNNYKRNGVATNTYLSSGAYINIATSNPLKDWTSVQTLELLFDAMVDPNTGLPINVGFDKTILVPSALKATGFHIERATEVDRVDNTASPVTFRAHSMNPLRVFNGGSPYKFASNQYVKRATNSTTRWFLGNFKKAFCRYFNWKEEITRASDMAAARFERDIWAQFKISTRDIVVSTEPRVVAYSDQ